MSEGNLNSASSNGGIKLGLALSGGGFRASFFHLGVLAQMAMKGLLRHVEVISTVSGGSIIGALYYLQVKQLLESTADSEITDQDYKVRLERIEVDFLKAVQRNFRMKTYEDYRANLRMIMPDYSRSDRIAELYNHFYRDSTQWESPDPIEMLKLKIRPLDSDADFRPEKDNEKRRAKVPILLINSASLNTGGNWRFTASWMGEPLPKRESVAELVKEVNKKPIWLGELPSYDQIVQRQQNFSLGDAVAASACFPGGFCPLAISDLYPDLRVQLVDGGVHENQGIHGLLDECCTHFVVSDASGLMDTENEPAPQVGPVLSRTFDIFQDRLREEELLRLLEGQGRPRVAFMNLRKGLTATTASWKNADDQIVPGKVVQSADTPPMEYGVDPRVQDLLSKIRTDIDSFTEVEAYSLMLDGYLMSELELQRLSDIWGSLDKNTGVDAPAWQFLGIESLMKDPSEPYLTQLAVANKHAFKVFLLLHPRWLPHWLTKAVLAGLAILILWKLVLNLWDGSNSLLVGKVLSIGIVLMLVLSAPGLARASGMPRKLVTLADMIGGSIGALILAAGSVFVKLHLKYFDPLFLRLGELRNLTRQPGKRED